MKILGLNISRSKKQSRDSDGSSLTTPSKELLSALGIGPGTTTANHSTAQKLSAFYQGVRLISQDVAGISIGFYTDINGSKEYLNNEVSRLFRSEVDPIGRVSKYKFLETTMKWLQIRGNSFAIIHRIPKLRLEFVPANKVTLWQDKYTLEVFYRIVDRTGPINGMFSSNDILHFKGLGDNPYWGDSVLKYAAKSLGIGLGNEALAEKLLENGTLVRDYFKHPGKLDDNAFNRLRSEIGGKYQGLNVAGNTPILEEGMEYHTVQVRAEDFQLLESKRTTILDVARWLNCPPDKLFDWTKVSYASMEQSSANYALQTIAPWATNIEQEINMKLLNTARGEYSRFNLESLIRADAVAKADSLSKLVAGSIFDRNEARSLYERNEKEGASQLLFPLNSIPDGKVEAYYDAKIEQMKKTAEPKTPPTN